jgi:hypothetical protein
MKIKTTLTIDINQYENIKPEIEIDTDNLEEAKSLILKLWDEFHGLCQYRFTPKEELDEINAVLQMGAESRKEFMKTDFKMQALYNKVLKGEPIPFSEWDKLSDFQKEFLHKAQLRKAQQDRLDKKYDNSEELGSTETEGVSAAS